MLLKPAMTMRVSPGRASHAVFEPHANAVGTDRLSFHVTTSAGTSADATVTIIYESGCYPDCDLSGTLDIFDFLCFQHSFVNGEPYACDCDPDPACDIFDFLCFQNAFVAGCP